MSESKNNWILRHKLSCHDIKTPCYVIDRKQFERNLFDIQNSFRNEWGDNLWIGYSIKTNHLPQLLEIAKNKGMLAEAVSDDEYYYAVEQGFDKRNIILNGPSKSEDCLICALESNSIVNIDNLEEVNVLVKRKDTLKNREIKVGLRANFDLEKLCGGETTTGKAGSRFGLCVENGEFEEAVNQLSALHVRICGLHLHFSTKTRSLKVFKILAEQICEIATKYGLLKNIEYLDIGGGYWGGRRVKDKPTMEEYSKVISRILKTKFDSRKVKLILEPGSALLSTIATYYTQVQNVRQIKSLSVVTVDGSLLHVNPLLNQRKLEYKIYASGEKNIFRQMVCGFTCLEKDRILQLDNVLELKKGDYVQIDYTGAYTMGFNNCFISLPPYIYMQENGKMISIRDKKRKLLLDI